jgi:hypothetical protein
LNNWLRKRSAALGGARKFAYRHDMSYFLRSIRLAFHLALRIIPCFLKNRSRSGSATASSFISVNDPPSRI